MREQKTATVVVDGKHYRPGQLISVEEMPVKTGTGGWPQ